MVNDSAIIKQDLQHIWHPGTYMKDFEQSPPLVVHRAEGSYLYTDRGPIIDAISSWWCKSLGHNHPAVTDAIKAQLRRFEHVIGADTTHAAIAELGERLANLSQLQHVYFASDGSSAVEIAMKLALHAMQIKGKPKRKRFIALQHAYHGETLATLSVTDLDVYKKPFTSFGLPCHFLQRIPYVSTKNDPIWNNCEEAWARIEPQLTALKETTCAIIVEPIVQGAGGMRCYSADFLRRLSAFAKQHDMYFIADEIMTGLGRTGKWLACEHAAIQPDIICLSKGLTSGSLPLSCALIDNAIYELFYDDPQADKAFLHSHTYSGHALAVSAAVATLRLMEAERIHERAEQLGVFMQRCFSDIAKQTGMITNVRSIGAMVAGEIDAPDAKRIGYQIHQAALARGALLRPLGHTLYWLPPLNTSHALIEQLAEITLHSLKNIHLL